MAFHAKVRIHYFIRAILLLALSCYIMHLNETRSLHYYLAPHMQKLLLLCPVPLWFMAIGLLWHTLTGSTEKICDCEHPLPTGLFRNVNAYGLFTVPLLLGLLLPDQALGSAMAVKKGMLYTLPAPELLDTLQRESGSPEPAVISRTKATPDVYGQQQSMNSASVGQQNLDEMFLAKDKYSIEFAELAKRLYTLSVIEVHPSIFSETIGAVDMYKQVFQDRPIRLKGFVYREGSMDANTFAISRFLMMCCPADAMPFGVLVAGNNAAAFPKDTWVEIEGYIKTTSMNGKDALSIQASQIRTIEEPTSPYIFTSPDSVAEFDSLYSRLK
ncbi:hypothetical protein D3C74_66530 [compost metagenome]